MSKIGTCGARELSVFWLSFQESDKMAVKQKNGYGWGKEEKDDLETNKCRNEMCEVHQKDSKWTEYLDFGPHGLSVIRNAGAHKVRVSKGPYTMGDSDTKLCASHCAIRNFATQAFLPFQSP